MGETDHHRELGVAATVKTLLLSDLVDSTRLIDQLGDAGAAALFRRHDRLARDLLERHGGLEIDKSDGFLLLFDRPVQAVRFAMAYHRALEKLSKEEAVELRSRVGIHVGEVILTHNDPRDIERGAKPIEVEGLAKPIAARLMNLAQARQTLISRSVFDMARRGEVGDETADPSLCWLSHGSYLVKGVEEKLEVFEVGLDDLAPLTAPPNVFTSPTLSQAIRQGLLRPGRRLWTAAFLILALLAAVWLVRSWFSSSTSRARPAVSILGFKNLAEDNEFTWVSTAFAEMLRTELGAGGGLRIISGENVARTMIELALPQTDSLAGDTLAKVRGHLGTDYVVLGSFLVLPGTEARSIRLDFRLQDAKSGETLALSSRTGRENDLFAIVTSAGAYLLDQLGVASPSAEAALAAKAELSESTDATALYSKALIKMRSYDNLAARDLLLEAVEADPGYALAHAALGEAWLKLGYDEEAEKSAGRAFRLAETKELARETVYSIKARYHEAASDWPAAIETYRLLWDFFPDSVEYGLRLAEVQRRSGRDSDALDTLAALRQMPEPARLDIRIDLMESGMAADLGDYPRALEVAEKTVARAREQKATVLLAKALRERSKVLRLLGERESSRADLNESRELFHAVGDRGQVASVNRGLAILLKQEGDLGGAEELYRESLAIHRQTGDRKGTSTVLNNLANISRFRGDLEEARQMLEESLGIVREIRDLRREPTRLHNLGWVYLEEGSLVAAREKVQQSRDAQKVYGSPVGAAWDDFLAGRISFAEGDLAQAQQYYSKSLNSAERTGAGNLEGRLLTDLAVLLVARDDLAAAGELLDRAERIHVERNEAGHLAETRLARSELLLELGEPVRAEEQARDAESEFAHEHRRDDVIAATAAISRALFAQGRTDEARKAFAEAGARAPDSQRPVIRIEVAMTGALLAAGGPDETLRDLEIARTEALRLGFLGLELEVRAELAAALGEDLEALAEEADEKGFSLLARKLRTAR